jgi:hypothetical protein
MALLADPERLSVGKNFCEELSRNREAFAVSKPDFRAAVNAIDDWVDANAASFNAAIPQPARGAMTTKQKAALLLSIVRRRWEVS